MSTWKRYVRVFFHICVLTFLLSATGIFISPFMARAQYWAALPPYNVLWPLWSPALSPVDPVTGVATPLVTTLTQNTILPVQPALAWDPLQPGGSGFPWLLYNTPAAFGGGLLYWDVYYGLNQWPPTYMLDSVSGAPAPISLPLSWSVLLPTGLNEWLVPLANAMYSYQYGVPISSLLTSADIWGLPLI